MRVTVLLKNEGDLEALVDLLRQEHDALVSLDEVAAARWGTAVEPLPIIAHGQVVTERFSAFLEVWTDGGDLSDDLWLALDVVGKHLGRHAVAAESAIVVGRYHPIIVREPTYLLMYPLRRLPAMERQDFFDYWLTTHSRDAIGHAAAPGGYGQLHADLELTARAALVTGFGVDDFDGICEAGHLDLHAFTEFMSGTAVAKGGIRLERNFIDHSRSALGLMRLRS